MGLITKEVEITPKSKAIQHYKNLGYSFKVGDTITVPVEHLQEKSSINVKCECDYCEAKFITKYRCFRRSISSVIPKIACKNCRYKKHVEVMKEKYGVENISQLDDVKIKKYNTNIKRYGMLYVQTDECKQKIIETDLKKYGMYHTQNDNIKQKTISTNILKYGCENPFQSFEIQEKIRTQLYKNNTVPTSSQQLYLCHLYNMELNYPIKKWNADMCDIDNKIIVEYNGGGHMLSVKHGELTLEDFTQKEIVREQMIKRDGYKIIHICSLKDYLPSDEILLNMLSNSKQYFSDYPNHSWISFDIDEGLVKNAENKDGVLFDYGKLRKITKKDL